MRKQILQMPNLRMNPLGLPQIGQRLYPRTLNFGFRIAFVLRDLFAKLSSFYILKPHIVNVLNKGHKIEPSAQFKATDIRLGAKRHS